MKAGRRDKEIELISLSRLKSLDDTAATGSAL